MDTDDAKGDEEAGVDDKDEAKEAGEDGEDGDEDKDKAKAKVKDEKGDKDMSKGDKKESLENGGGKVKEEEEDRQSPLVRRRVRSLRVVFSLWFVLFICYVVVEWCCRFETMMMVEVAAPEFMPPLMVQVLKLPLLLSCGDVACSCSCCVHTNTHGHECQRQRQRQQEKKLDEYEAQVKAAKQATAER